MAKPKAKRAKPKPKRKSSGFNFATLESRVLAATREAFEEVKAAHPGQQLCALALYSDDGAMTVCPSINTAEHLAKQQRADPKNADASKFCPAEWKFESVGADDAFNQICDDVGEYVLRGLGNRSFDVFREKLFETCVRVLERLRTDRAFADVLFMFDVSDGEESASTLLAWMKRLNSPDVVAEFRRFVKRS